MDMSKFKREPFITLIILVVGFILIHFGIKYDIHRKSPPNLFTFSVAGLVLGFFLKNIFLHFFVKRENIKPYYMRICTIIFALSGTIAGVLLCYHIYGTAS